MRFMKLKMKNYCGKINYFSFEEGRFNLISSLLTFKFMLFYCLTLILRLTQILRIYEQVLHLITSVSIYKYSYYFKL